VIEQTDSYIFAHVVSKTCIFVGSERSLAE